MPNKKPIFTTKHYKAIAKVMKLSSNNVWDKLDELLFRVYLVDMFKKDNPKFDLEKFGKLGNDES